MKKSKFAGFFAERINRFAAGLTRKKALNIKSARCSEGGRELKARRDWILDPLEYSKFDRG